MKLHVKPLSLILISGCFVLSCQHKAQNNDEVVYQTVHRYGVSLEPQDWSSRGQNGQIKSIRNDGVTVVRNFDAGILEGESTYSFPYREMIQKKEFYTNGTLTRDLVYYPSGSPKSQTDYSPDGTYLTNTWYDNGSPFASETFKKGKLVEGEYLHDQTVESRISNGEGTKITRDDYGQLLSKDTYQNGQLVSSTTYHANGTPSSITPYVNGVIQGGRRTYLPNGEPATIETWVNGIQQGTTIVFEYGEKKAEVPYVNGLRNGIEKKFSDDGKTVIQEWTWVDDQKHGPVTTYVGNIKKVDWYFHNQQVPSKTAFDMMNNRQTSYKLPQ